MRNSVIELSLELLGRIAAPSTAAITNEGNEDRAPSGAGQMLRWSATINDLRLQALKLSQVSSSRWEAKIYNQINMFFNVVVLMCHKLQCQNRTYCDEERKRKQLIQTGKSKEFQNTI